MIRVIKSAALWGIEAYEVQVEVDCSQGLPGISIVGLPNSTVRESRERVFAALKNNGFAGINKKITINLAPADIKKEGAAFDLPMAIGVLEATGQISCSTIHEFLIFGELSLEGKLRPIKGALSLAIMARNNGVKKIILPDTNQYEASVIKGVDIYGVKTLKEAIYLLQDIRGFAPFQYQRQSGTGGFNHHVDFNEVKGQVFTKRSMEVAASGGHNFLLIGSPGCGKSMCAKRVPSILPDMGEEEAIETTQIYSGAGLLTEEKGLLKLPPMRAPHHTISQVSLVGGGTYPKPGEVSLSHNGLLFLDELTEFPKVVLEVLRQPLEDGKVNISRTAMSVSYPSRFMLGATMNPCPCGYLGDPIHQCSCSVHEIKNYLRKISGPLLDRIDIQVEVPSLNYTELSEEFKLETSEQIRERVCHVRAIQKERFKKWKGVYCNAHMENRQIELYCRLDAKSQSMLEKAMKTFSFSARAYHRILKLARTVADMAGSENVKFTHISEAIQYRSLDKYKHRLG